MKLTTLREDIGLSRYETAELLKRSELRHWIDEIHEILKEGQGDEEDEEPHYQESDEENVRWVKQYERR